MSQTAPKMFILDGKDLGLLGLIVSTVTGWRDIPPTRKKSIHLAGRDGDVAVGSSLEISSRIVTINGTIHQDTLAEVKSSIQEISGRLRVAKLARFIDNDDRFMNVHVADMQIIPMAAQFTAPDINIKISIQGLDPFIFKTALTSIAFTITKNNTDLGNVPVRPLITINGAVTNPSIIYRNSASVIISQMDIVATVAGGDRIEIDSSLHTVKHFIGGSPSNIIKDVTGPFPVLDPEDADDQFAASPVWPTLECTPTASCTSDYNKAYVA